jgi:hypothetical protein
VIVLVKPGTDEIAKRILRLDGNRARNQREGLIGSVPHERQFGLLFQFSEAGRLGRNGDSRREQIQGCESQQQWTRRRISARMDKGNASHAPDFKLPGKNRKAGGHGFRFVRRPSSFAGGASNQRRGVRVDFCLNTS